jgi:fatty-acyl-CoA synthase
MLQWPDSTLFQGFADVAAAGPDRTALVFGGDRLTYGALLDRSRRLSRGLAGLGVTAGDAVATWLGNRPAWVVCQLALSRLGAAMVAVNTRYRTHELEYLLRDSGASVLVTERSLLDTDYHAMVAEVVPDLRTATPATFDPDGFPALEAVVSLDPEPDYPALRRYETVRDGDGDPAGEPASDAHAPVAVFYTSGTTSDPKGCLQPSRSVLNHSFNAGAHLDVTPGDVTVSMLPFCGIWGYNLLFSALSRGASIAVRTHFEPARVLDAIESEGVTYTCGTAAMYRRLLDHERFGPGVADTVSRAVVGFLGGGFDADDFRRFEAAFDCPFVQPYGSSEANSMVFVGDPDDPAEERTRVGGPLVSDDTETRIVDPETREPLSTGELGELAIRGYNCFREYLDDPEATAAAVDDGWFHTGDLCTVDADGCHEFHARLDDAIRTRGFLVAPAEIERAIDAGAGVARSQVVGVPHDRHGEVPVAFVERADPIEAGDVEAGLADRLADYKVPAATEFVDGFPTTEGPNGVKVRKADLRDRAADLVPRADDT